MSVVPSDTGGGGFFSEGIRTMQRVRFIVGSIVAICTLYVGLYYLLVERRRGMEFTNRLMWEETYAPDYLFQQEALAIFFAPIHHLDRSMRSKYWQVENPRVVWPRKWVN